MRTKDYTGSDVARVLSFKTDLIKMKWRSNLDSKNCGVYLMKHMETYTTEPLVEWNCDLKANNVSIKNTVQMFSCYVQRISYIVQNYIISGLMFRLIK